MTRRGWLHEAPFSENYSMRHVDSTRTTQRGWLDEGMTRRGQRRGSLDEARWFDEIILSHNQEWIPKLVTVVCDGHLFCELCWRVFLFFIFYFFYFRHLKSIVLIIIDTFHFILLSAFLPVSFVTWMIMVLMVFSILFQDYDFNATNCTHKYSCAFSPCVQIYFSPF